MQNKPIAVGALAGWKQAAEPNEVKKEEGRG
jgi:hypothetical protein